MKARRGWRIGILAAEDSLARQMRVSLRSRFETQNGGIPVRYLVSEKLDRAQTRASNAECRSTAGEG